MKIIMGKIQKVEIGNFYLLSNMFVKLIWNRRLFLFFFKEFLKVMLNIMQILNCCFGKVF